MKMKQRRRGTALQRRSPGQSIVLIALVLAILVGLVALSVDVGNAYAEQRAAQRASNAAAVEGMRVITTGGTNSDAYRAIKATLEAHKIKVVDGSNGAVAAPGERVLNAFYVFGDGRTERIPISSDAIPSNVQYIKVELSGSQATNFAGVVGQGSLPINADAYSSFDVCPPYPIAVAQDAFSNPPFPYNEAGDGYYSDENHERKPMRRMYLRDDATATKTNQTITTGADPKGQFVWLRWRNTSSVNDALEGIYEGLLDPAVATNGIEEVMNRVPVETFDKNPADDAYPTKRGNPSEWDLIRGGPFVKFGPSYSIPHLPRMGDTNDPTGNQNTIELKITKQLEWLIENRTLMNLVEYDRATPNAIRQGANIRISGFGGYMIVSYGYESEASGNRGSGWFLDLVKVGPPLKCVTNEGEVFFDTGDKVTLQGNMHIRPEFSSELNRSAPLDIVIVLDASGSMNWTWDGRGTASSNLISYDGGALVDIIQQKHGYRPKAGDDVDCIALLNTYGCQSADAYANASQRRLAIAKNAIKGFINEFPWVPGDRLALVTYRGAGNPAGLTALYPSGGLTMDVTTVADALMNTAATHNGEQFLTLGASPGALGLQRAQQVLEAGGDPSRNRFVIFFSDGLLNVNLQGVNTGDESIDANWDPLRIKTHYPINQAVNVAEAMRTTENNSFPTIIYTVALGNTYDVSGLPLVATEANAPYFNIASDPNALPTLLENIGARIKNEGCNPTTLEPQAPALGTMYRFRNGEYVPAVGADGTPSLGTVTVRDSSGGFVAKADIGANGFFKIPNLLPNTNYILSFNNISDDPVFYMGYDGKYRNYSRIADPNGNTEITVRTQVTGINNTVTLNNGVPLVIYLTGKDVCSTGGSGGSSAP